MELIRVIKRGNKIICQIRHYYTYIIESVSYIYTAFCWQYELLCREVTYVLFEAPGLLEAIN